MPALEMIFLIHRDIVSSDAAVCGFPYETKNCLISGESSFFLISTTQNLWLLLNL